VSEIFALERLQALHLLLELLDLLFQPRGLGRAGRRRLLPVGAVQLVQVAHNAFLNLICAIRRSILARVKFLSRLLTALNLLPSIAMLASAKRPIVRQSATKRTHT
jgi:hypothetical protein